MKRSMYLLCIGIIIIAAVYYFIKSGKETKSFKDQYKSFVSTTATITAKKSILGPKARLTTTYSVTFRGNDGKEYKQTTNSLGTSYETEDTLTIFYNPQDPYDAVVDKTSMENGSDMFNYNKIIPYAAGTIILIGFLFYTLRKQNRN